MTVVRSHSYPVILSLFLVFEKTEIGTLYDRRYENFEMISGYKAVSQGGLTYH